MAGVYVMSMPTKWQTMISMYLYINRESETFYDDIKNALDELISNDRNKITHTEKLTYKSNNLARVNTKDELLYDIFICGSLKDRHFLQETVVKELEQKGYKLCLPWRDFIAGIPIFENIQMSILESKKTVVVWQRNWPDVRNAYCLSLPACVRGLSGISQGQG